MIRVLFVFGTRPEAIKLAPVIRRLLNNHRDFEVRVAVTAQHRGMLDQVLDAFAVRPDHDLNLMQPGQTLFQSTSRIIAALEPVLQKEQPHIVLVQGDTTTTLCGALAAFYAGSRVGHVEAGLRTGDPREPFPEEINRVLTSRIATLHFAPTEAAAENLRSEGVDSARVFVTGNTGIDAVLDIRDQLAGGRLKPAHAIALDPRKKLILVTAHRRESFGEGFERIARALARLAQRDDTEVIYPVHPNPQVREPILRNLAGTAVRMIDPLPYIDFVDLMCRAHFLLTDSGGVQEEAPSLGKPVLVMREKTERPEAVHAGTAVLVGTDEAKIQNEANLLLDDPAEYQRRSRIHNPYGDGQASRRIESDLQSYFHDSSQAVQHDSVS
jgi:UDP-N-acetylglucosamine 2-epimerase (non-hydrolysing)